MSASNKPIVFSAAAVMGRELEYVAEAIASGSIIGDGPFTQRCSKWLEQTVGAKRVLLTTSCTSALELAAMLCNIGPGDEVIMPSYTFVSTANAFVRSGATIKFVDVRPDTLNLDENLLEAAVTKKTRAIVPVHYAGIACEMDRILDIAARHNVTVIEDAAQGVACKYKGSYLGTLGTFGAFSFHGSKNFVCGEGGAIVINDDAFVERAEILREKGTNRSKFLRGQADKYTWLDEGSSFLPSDILAAFLFGQLEAVNEITDRRMTIWNTYSGALASLEKRGLLRLPFVPDACEHNGHMFYVLARTTSERDALMAHLHAAHIHAVFHYVPLHSSPMGIKLNGGKAPTLPVTEDISGRILRLPLYHQLTTDDQARVVNEIERFFSA